MKIFKLILMLLFALFLLSGCLYGQCLNGPCALERKKILESIKPYGTYWIKEGADIEQRREDSWACGAAKTALAADHVIFNQNQLQHAKHPDDKDDFAARERLTKAWVACMKSKGYHYKK